MSAVWLREMALIALGGGVGALARHGLVQGLFRLFGRDWPYGVLLANALGSFLIGLIFAWLLESARGAMHWEIRAFITIGFLGAFTTFSTFSMDTVRMLEQGFYAGAAANILLNVTLSLGLCFLGLIIGRSF